MVNEFIFGINKVFFYTFMAIFWILLLLGLYYRRNELSQRRFYGILGMGIIWLIYFLFNLNHSALTAVPMVITLGIDVLLGIVFLVGCYISIKTYLTGG